MLKIKLYRVGKRDQPSYRIVVSEARSKANAGYYVEAIGHYNPMTNPTTVSLDTKAYKAWLAKGAQPTDTVRRLAEKELSQ